MITKLDKHHQKADFDCGNEALNRFIRQQAGQLLKRNETVIYGAVDKDRLAGFYTLSACQIMQADDEALLKKQSPHSPIGCVLLGRLAVDKRYKGKGLGSDLLLHAMRTVRKLSHMMGLAFVIVDAKDDNAQAFYEKYGFRELTRCPKRLCYAVKDIPLG
nr:GNAT family N-acetyltransferase [Neisseria lisongii]